ncbi:MAG: L-alanine-DL-glutamate epimerase, partial [Bacteroidota bacterium]|nr:L-alanine-DL-glutamate epimerase [Bacteroidota bacterium]
MNLRIFLQLIIKSAHKLEENKKMDRRQFLNRTGAFIPFAISGAPLSFSAASDTDQLGVITLKTVDSNFEREPLNPYRFKGSAITEAWQVAVRLQANSGASTIGIGTQNILWSDSNVFAAHSQSGGNALMYALTERALEIVKRQSFTDPIQLLDLLLPEVWSYGKRITNNPNLR